MPITLVERYGVANESSETFSENLFSEICTKKPTVYISYIHNSTINIIILAKKVRPPSKIM